MRKTIAIHCIVATLLCVLLARKTSFAGEPTQPAAQIPKTGGDANASDRVLSANTPIAAEYEGLGIKYEKLANARDAEIPLDTNEPADLTLSDDEWLARRRAARAKAPNPDAILPRFIAFAEAHPNSPLAFDAVFFVVRKSAFQEFRADGTPSPVLKRALELAWRDHKDDPRMVHLLYLIAIPTRESETFLKRAAGEAPNRTVRAAATFQLARYYSIIDGCYKKTQRATGKKNSKPTNEDRFWKLVVVPNLEKYLPTDREENAKRIDALFNQVVADYSDVPLMGWRMPGPGNIYVQTDPTDPPKTYGKEAAAILYEKKHLTPGNPAPEIIGQDADGKTFRLSDYRGKAVMLTFCADWCPGCVELLPIQRRLADKFAGKPFVILSVNCDKSVETLKSRIAAGDITWRCWRDGESGPIRTAWHSGLPGVTLLDEKHIIQDCELGPANTAEEFEEAIAALIENGNGS